MLQPFETPLCLETAATLHAAICLGIIETRVTWRFDCASLPARLRRRAMQGEPCATHGQPLAPPPRVTPPTHHVNARVSALRMRRLNNQRCERCYQLQRVRF